MAKTIKFNLICDNNPIRTIEDLQNNFSIEDVLEYYDSKILHRWLKVRGFEKEFKQVESITSENSIDIIKELVKIFDIETDEKKVEENIYIYNFLEESKELCAIYNKRKYKVKEILEDYSAGYKQLIDDIIDNPDDIAKIKANISEMIDNYAWVLELNHRELFYTLKDSSLLAIMCLLMNEKSRKYYLPIELETDDGTKYLDIENNFDKKNMFKKICDIVADTSSLKEKLGDNLISFSGVTDGYWKDLESKESQFMVISIGNGDFVRSSGDKGGDKDYNDIYQNFLILNGLDYKSNSTYREILYMEV